MKDDVLKPVRIFIVRHGETPWALSGRHTGRTEIELSERGKIQAKTLAVRLAHTRFTQVMTSPRRRAIETCQLAGLGSGSVSVPDLAEWDYGAYEGMTSNNIRKAKPGWTLFVNGCPDGETPDEVSDRADQLIVRLRSLSGNVVVFTHGQFSCALGIRWIGLPLSEAQHLQLNTAAISIVSFDEHHPDVPVIAVWNDVGTVFDLGTSAYPQLPS